MSENISRPHFDALPWLIRYRLNLRLGSGRSLALKTAGETRDTNLLAALAERFPRLRELHIKILRNPAATAAPEVLAAIEHTCRDAIVKLPFVKSLMALAKETQEVKELCGCVLSPLKVVRMATCLNPLIGRLQETANDAAVREAIPENKRLLAAEPTREFFRYILGQGSGERPRPTTPPPPTGQVVRSPVPATAPRATPSGRPTPPRQLVDMDGGIPAIRLRTPPAPAKPTGAGPLAPKKP